MSFLSLAQGGYSPVGARLVHLRKSGSAIFQGKLPSQPAGMPHGQLHIVYIIWGAHMSVLPTACDTGDAYELFRGLECSGEFGHE
jgi:hypothetical protein